MCRTPGGLDHLHGGKLDLKFQNNKIFKICGSGYMVFLVESQPVLSKGGTLRQQDEVHILGSVYPERPKIDLREIPQPDK